MQQNQTARAVFSGGSYWKHLYFWNCSLRKGFAFFACVMILFIMRVNVKTLEFAKGCVNDTWKRSLAAKFSSVYTPDCDVLSG